MRFLSHFQWRLLKLGGATVHELDVPIRRPRVMAAMLTHVFVDEGQADAAKSLQARGVLCVHPVYIGDYLMQVWSFKIHISVM